MTTPTHTGTTIWNIIDLADGTIAGQAPGASQYHALEAFSHDALGGDNRIDNDGEPTFILYAEDGARYRAEVRTSALQPLEAHPADTGGDVRYTVAAIAAMDQETVVRHLHERQAQLERAKRDLDRERHITEVADPDSRRFAESLDTQAQLAREAATQRTIIRRLEQRDRDICLKLIADQPARGKLEADLVDSRIFGHGLPCGIEEAGDEELAQTIWNRALEAIEADGTGSIAPSGAPTNGDVAQRVADAYAVIYGMAQATR